MTPHLDDQIAELAEADTIPPQELTHLMECPRCSELLQEAREAIASFLCALPPEQPALALREQLLRATAAPIGQHALFGFYRRIAELLQCSESEVAQALSRVDSSTAWGSFGIEGIEQQLIAPSPAPATAFLIRCQPGVAFPYHLHDGDETSIMLRGFAVEDSGRLLAPGDILHRGKDTPHSLVADKVLGCMFLVLLRGGLPRFKLRS
jgi:anti-sigma factor ChrR (cupin superfamily)